MRHGCGRILPEPAAVTTASVAMLPFSRRGGNDLTVAGAKMRRQRDRRAVWWLVTSQLTAAAAACLASGAACGKGPPDPSVFQPIVPVTLAWDQPDGLAEWYEVKTGALLLQVDHPTVRLQLDAGAHRVEIVSCNEGGCSPPVAVILDYREGRWTLGSAGHAEAEGEAPLGIYEQQRRRPDPPR
jgi:hypothetical protein